MSTGQWDAPPPSCQAVERGCPDPGTPDNAVRQVSDESFTIGTRIVFGCQSGYTLEGMTLITCMEGGQWDAQPPLCIEMQPQNSCV